MDPFFLIVKVQSPSPKRRRPWDFVGDPLPPVTITLLVCRQSAGDYLTVLKTRTIARKHLSTPVSSGSLGAWYSDRRRRDGRQMMIRLARPCYGQPARLGFTFMERAWDSASRRQPSTTTPRRMFGGSCRLVAHLLPYVRSVGTSSFHLQADGIPSPGPYLSGVDPVCRPS